MARGLHRPSGMPRARLAARGFAVCIATLLAMFRGPRSLAPLPARAGLPAIIVVNTTSDAVFPDDGVSCSLRAAILAANHTDAGYCGTGTALQDSIRFNIGGCPAVCVPVINVGSDLPAITNPVIINGNTFGATRVF